MEPKIPTPPERKTEQFQGFNIHAKVACTPPCPFHAPSDHPLKDAPIHIRADKMMLVERTCSHGVGHDDPDSVAYMQAHGQKWAGVHGCDGCCASKSEQVEPSSEADPSTRHEFEIFGRHRKPHCTYCGEVQRPDNIESRCWERE